PGADSSLVISFTGSSVLIEIFSGSGAGTDSTLGVLSCRREDEFDTVTPAAGSADQAKRLFLSTSSTSSGAALRPPPFGFFEERYSIVPAPGRLSSSRRLKRSNRVSLMPYCWLTSHRLSPSANL